MRIGEYGEFDAIGLAELVRSGRVSAAELLDEALARTAAVNPKINAVVHLMERRARQEIAAGLPEGPFRGVRSFLVKDLMTAVAGEPMRCGSRLFRDYVPAEDEELTRRYRRAGLVIFGKTISRSLAFRTSPSRSCSARPEIHGTSIARPAVPAAVRLQLLQRASWLPRMPTTAGAPYAPRRPTAAWSA